MKCKFIVLIETLWNVNMNTFYHRTFKKLVLIETLWNVNLIMPFMHTFGYEY